MGKNISNRIFYVKEPDVGCLKACEIKSVDFIFYDPEEYYINVGINGDMSYNIENTKENLNILLTLMQGIEP